MKRASHSDADTQAQLARLDARYRAPLMTFFLRRVGERAEAEDLTQEVFARMAARGGRADIENADSFVFTVAANLLRDRARMAASRHRFAHQRLEDFQENSEIDASLVEHLSPDRVLLGRETLKDVLAALDMLSVRTRSIFVLYRLENMERRDIARLYGISVSAVEKHIAKALEHLIERLDRR